jgi:hypothetical protein
MGFPSALFAVQGAPPSRMEDWDCAICHDVVDDATLCRQGHTCASTHARQLCCAAGGANAPAACADASHARSFCRACITEALAHKRECPMDRQPLTATSLVPNFMLNNHLSAHTVVCLHAAAITGAAADCAWSGRLDSLCTHLGSTCPLEPAACQWAGCSATAARMALPAHEAGCRHRLLPCPHAGCAERATTTLLAEHTARCAFAPVPCANAGCAMVFHRQQAEAHKAACAFEIVACPVAGCAGLVARGAMAAHLQVESVHHISLLSSRLVAAEERATAAEQRAAALQQQANNSTSKLTSVSREVEELKRQAGKRKRDADAGDAGAAGAIPQSRFRPPELRLTTPSRRAHAQPASPPPARARPHVRAAAPPPAPLPAAPRSNSAARLLGLVPAHAVRADAVRTAAARASRRFDGAPFRTDAQPLSALSRLAAQHSAAELFRHRVPPLPAPAPRPSALGFVVHAARLPGAHRAPPP